MSTNLPANPNTTGTNNINILTNPATVNPDDSMLFSPFIISMIQVTSMEDAINHFKEGLDSEAAAKFDEIYDDYGQVLFGNSPEGGGSGTIKKRKVKDSSIGGNDAINCYPQYHDDDDIIHPMLAIDPHNLTRGLGRVYSEVIDDHQQIMYFTLGVPEFSNILEFFTNAVNSRVASMMNNGADETLFHKLSSLAGSILGGVIALPFVPIIFIRKLVGFLNYPVSKYYDLKGTMPLYYRICNSILAHLTVNMGEAIMTDADLGDNLKGGLMGGGSPEDNQWATTIYDPFSSDEGESTGSPQSSSNPIPSIFDKHGIDIFKIMQVKDVYSGLLEASDMKTLDEAIEELSNSYEGMNTMEKLRSGFAANFNRSCEFVGVRIEKTTDSSESFSNATGPSGLAEKWNSMSQSKRDARFSVMEGNLIAGAAEVKKAITGFLSSVTEMVAGDSGTNFASLITGSGFLDIPEIYKSSSFSKSYSFKMPLRATYGHGRSIVYDLYIPLAMLLAAASPRQVGKNSYTNPFYLRAYCRGMFSIPLGMIESITITRGDSEYGWNIDRLPLALDINFNIKDMSPVMFVGVADKALHEMFGANNSFQEYMLTLSGVGLKERLLLWDTYEKRIKIAWNTLMNNTINPRAIGFRAGNLGIITKLAALNPTVNLPTT